MQKPLILKILTIVTIALFLMIPMGLISDKIEERNEFKWQARDAVEQSWTSSQTLIGPFIVVPYIIENEVETFNKQYNEVTVSVQTQSKHIFMLPEQLNIDAQVNNNLRHKGIYSIPVYISKLDINAAFDLIELQDRMSLAKLQGDKVTFSQPYLTTAVSDQRGINRISEVTFENISEGFTPGSRLATLPQGVNAALHGLLENKNERIELQFELELRGMEALSLIPMGLNTTVAISSNWPHPEFSGVFLPTAHTIEKGGYQAKWQVSAFASNVVEKAKACESGDCKALHSSVFGVNHIDPVDVYLRSERSVKYSLLFIGLSFIAFFLFEILKKLPIHPIQYTLVGCAIALFYLLLFSLSEHIAFSLAYFIATVSCVSLMFFYLKFVLKGKKEAAVFSVLMFLLYSVLFVIISAEDYGLMMGAILSFITLAVVMMFTRNIDWYEAGSSIRATNRISSGTATVGENQ